MARLITFGLFLYFGFALNQPLNAQCSISNLVATTSECDGNFFYVTLDFQYAGVGPEGFKVQGNGQNYGNFSYSNLPVTIGPLLGNGTTIYEFVVKDLLYPGCSAFTVLEPVNCGNNDCHIFDVIAEAHPCENGQFLLDIAFQYANTGSQGFTIKANGQVLGSFAYGQSFYTVGPLSGGVLYEIVIRDNQFPDCKKVFVFGPVNCGGGECHIYDLVAEASECNEDGKFFVTIDFQHENTSDKFKILGNGVNYGIFNYANLPIIIGPLAGNGTTNYGFLIRDLQFENCAEDIHIGTVSCPVGGECKVVGLVAEAGECLEDGTYNIWVNFSVENAPNNFYDLFHNGEFVGFHPLSQVPEIIAHVTGNGHPFQVVKVCINDHPQCCAVFEYAAPECEGQLNSSPGDAPGRSETENDKLLISPNPAGKYVLITHVDGLPIEFAEVRNMKGQVLIFEENKPNQLEISDLAPGIYMLKAKAGDRFWVKKLVKW